MPRNGRDQAVSLEVNPSRSPGDSRTRPIGLVGGLGIGAAVQVYKALVFACLNEGVSPVLTIAHADVDRVLALAGGNRKVELAVYLAGVIRTLADAGAQVVAIPALTPHLCFPDLIPISPVPLVSMLTLTAEELQRRGLSRVALFGTRTTIESHLFGALQGVDVVQPRPDEIGLIRDTYVGLVRSGRGTAEQAATLRQLAHALIRRDGAEAIVMAGTELALLFSEQSADFPAVDCGDLLVRALVRQAIDGLIRTTQ